MAKKTQQVLVAVDNCIFTVDEGRLDVLLIQMKQTRSTVCGRYQEGSLTTAKGSMERRRGFSRSRRGSATSISSSSIASTTSRGTRAAGSSRSLISHSSSATVSNCGRPINIDKCDFGALKGSPGNLL